MTNHINDGEKITPEWLGEHGFYLVGTGYDDRFHPYNFDYPVNEEDQWWVEKEFDRRRFSVVLSPRPDNDCGWDQSIMVQEDAGCGWVEIPGGWSEWSVKQLQYIYEAIRGKTLS